MLFSRAQERDYDAIVLYFQHAANSVDHLGGVAIIMRWACAEDQWGLRFYFGDRDDVAASGNLDENFSLF